MPDEGGALEAPIVPATITTQVVFLVESQVASIQSSLLLKGSQGFVLIFLPIGLDEFS